MGWAALGRDGLHLVPGFSVAQLSLINLLTQILCFQLLDYFPNYLRHSLFHYLFHCLFHYLLDYVIPKNRDAVVRASRECYGVLACGFAQGDTAFDV